jgi:hypothetical protein
MIITLAFELYYLMYPFQAPTLAVFVAWGSCPVETLPICCLADIDI